MGQAGQKLMIGAILAVSLMYRCPEIGPNTGGSILPVTMLCCGTPLEKLPYSINQGWNQWLEYQRSPDLSGLNNIRPP